MAKNIIEEVRPFEYPKDMLTTAKMVAEFNRGSKNWAQPADYSALRLAEELNELAKELICFSSRPAKTDGNMIAAEIADVILRLEIFLEAAKNQIPVETIKGVVEEKCRKYVNYIQSGEKDII